MEILVLLSQVFGWFLHIAKRATLRKAKTEGVWYRKVVEFIRFNGAAFWLRFGVGVFLTIMWIAHPGAANKFTSIFAQEIPVTGWLGSAIAKSLMAIDIRPNIITGFLFGYSFDSIADWFAARFEKLKEELPPMAEPPAEGEEKAKGE